MLGQGNQAFIEADLAPRSERTTAHFPSSPSFRLTWLQRVIDSIAQGGDPRHGADRLDIDGPMIRPAGRTSTHSH
jgi:hypothetical protein